MNKHTEEIQTGDRGDEDYVREKVVHIKDEVLKWEGT